MIKIALDNKAVKEVQKAIGEGGGTAGGSDYEVEFCFEDELTQLGDITVQTYLIKDEEANNFMINFINNSLESIGLPYRVANVPDIIILAEQLKDGLGAVIVTLMCNFMFGKLFRDANTLGMSYFNLFGEEDYGENCWYLYIGKTQQARFTFKLADFSESPYNITTSYLKYVKLVK